MRKRFGGKQKTSLCHWQSVTQWYSKKIWVDGGVRKQVRKAIRAIRICASSSVICGVSRTVGLFDQSRTLAAAKCFLNNKQPMVRGNATKKYYCRLRRRLGWAVLPSDGHDLPRSSSSTADRQTHLLFAPILFSFLPRNFQTRYTTEGQFTIS